MLYGLALILTGIWLILFSQNDANETLDIIFGALIIAAAFFETPWGVNLRRRA